LGHLEVLILHILQLISLRAHSGWKSLGMERGAGGAHRQGSPAAGDRVFVAVDEVNGGSTLLWALRNLAKEDTMIAVAHVHCPPQTIPVSKYPVDDGIMCFFSLSSEFESTVQNSAAPVRSGIS